MSQRNIGHVGMCHDCGKKCYTSRKRAKLAARTLHPEEQLATYQCGDWWHYGHLSYGVKKGWNARG